MAPENTSRTDGGETHRSRTDSHEPPEASHEPPEDSHEPPEDSHEPPEDSHEPQADHAPPAPLDWPRGYAEASWWPFVAALGAGGLYVGLGLVALGQGDQPLVAPAIGAAVATGGLLVLLGGLLGWTYHGFASRFRERAAGHAGKFHLATVLFLATEVATFGAGFFYYFTIRVGPWPPGDLPDLLTSLVLVNTLVLVASSVTLHRADGALRRGNHARFSALLFVTLALGVAFLAGQVWEYYEFVVREGLTIASGAYFNAFFGLTGLHGLHVLFGVLGLGVLLVRAWAGQYSANRHTSVTTVATYWHFVDAVWLFLVTTLYVGATVSPGGFT